MADDTGQSASQAHQYELAAGIVCAYVSNNHVQAGELPDLIRAVHAALAQLGQPSQDQEPAVEKPTAAQIRKSVTPDALISFIDGKHYKTLKRHLTRHGLDLAAYRERYGLPADYPTTAANYAAQRSALARSIGLGKGLNGRWKGQETAPAEEVEAMAAEPATPKPRGRRKLAAE